MRINAGSRAQGVAATFLLALASTASARINNTGDSNVVEDGKTIGIEYTLTLADGTVADSNVGGEALTYTQGESQILPTLEQALSGHAVGDEIDVQIAAADGYGDHDPELRREVPAEQIPEEAREVGQVLVGQGPEGQPVQVTVHEVQGDSIVLDFNHPLAGQDLSFKVKVMSVE